VFNDYIIPTKFTSQSYQQLFGNTLQCRHASVCELLRRDLVFDNIHCGPLIKSLGV